ncbi:phosphinothricin acetyltransferase [Litoreibacter ponti]|uniref:Phosphinothricin acetyltransferase n=1 Tax=Litoreibacter ponti TaxID=1510457 RepID=A0A2T6BDH2_9RHOB|nr:GNAT family N-acetyltransferase [Litoreibacter ponti]PTX54099.1 phosphinothricin acetyltransferase [Litoreibacter ponti]
MIRPAKLRDADAIVAILNPIIQETTITFTSQPATYEDVFAGIEAHARRSDPYLVVETDGAVVGFAKYGPFRNGDGYARAAEITVHLAETARGLGLGRDLVDALVRHGRAAGIHTLIAGISAENDNALKFHAKLGFREAGRVADAGYKFGRYIDLILLQKIL